MVALGDGYHGTRRAWLALILPVLMGQVLADAGGAPTTDVTSTRTTTTTWTTRTITTTIYSDGAGLPSSHNATTSTSSHATSQTTTVLSATLALSATTPPSACRAPPASTATPATSGFAMGSNSGSSFNAAVLNSTNYYRAQHEAANVTVDSALADYAQKHAQTCLWEHSGGPHGENLAAGFDDPTLAIDAWGNEEHKYNYGKPGFSEDTGHFTQLVWKATTKVGCGAVRCNSTASNGVKGWYFVCEYETPGNVLGQFQSNVTKPGVDSHGRLGLVSAAADGGIRLGKVAVALGGALLLSGLLLR